VLLVANAEAPVRSSGVAAAFLGGASTVIVAKQTAAADELGKHGARVARVPLSHL
jgi:hypothetical protein